MRGTRGNRSHCFEWGLVFPVFVWYCTLNVVCSLYVFQFWRSWRPALLGYTCLISVCTVFYRGGNSLFVIFGYKNSQVSLSLESDDHVPVLCSAQIVCRNSCEPSYCGYCRRLLYTGQLLWTYGTLVGRDIAIVFWKYIQTLCLLCLYRFPENNGNTSPVNTTPYWQHCERLPRVPLIQAGYQVSPQSNAQLTSIQARILKLITFYILMYYIVLTNSKYF